MINANPSSKLSLKSFRSMHSMNRLPTVILLGLQNHGLALLRSLGRRGIPVEVLESDCDQFQQYSKYCRALAKVKSLDDESLLDYLIENGKRNENKKVLFITKDKTVPIISKGRELLKKY